MSKWKGFGNIKCLNLIYLGANIWKLSKFFAFMKVIAWNIWYHLFFWVESFRI